MLLPKTRLSFHLSAFLTHPSLSVTGHVFLPTSNSDTPKQTLALCFYSDVGLLFKRELIMFCMLPVWMSPAPRSVASLSTAPLHGSSSLQAHHTQNETHLLPKLAPPPAVSVWPRIHQTSQLPGETSFPFSSSVPLSKHSPRSVRRGL